MNATAMLLKEIENMPEETISEVLNFTLFLKNKTVEISNPKQISMIEPKRISIKDAYGIFKDLKGMDTTIEREEEFRV